MLQRFRENKSAQGTLLVSPTLLWRIGLLIIPLFLTFLETFILLDPDVPSGLFYKFTKEIPIPKSPACRQAVKRQISTNHQWPNSNPTKSAPSLKNSEFLLIRDWNLFWDWYLEFGILPWENPLHPPLLKRERGGFTPCAMRYAPCSLLYAISDCSDLLPHKDEIANSKAEFKR